MIECRKYKDEDFYSIIEWYEARHIRPAQDMIPPTGFIVPGIAAGFLMRTDTSACILEPFIANPCANKHDRDKALNAIMSDLINEARHLGYDRVFGFSSHERMLERAVSQGFIIVEESTTVVKELI